MAEGEEGQTQAEATVTITDEDKATMSFLRSTKSEEWHSGTIESPSIAYKFGMDVYFVNEQPMYILKDKLSGGGLPVRETTVIRNKNKVAIADFIQRVNSGEITKLKSITYSRNKNNGMLVATEIELN